MSYILELLKKQNKRYIFDVKEKRFETYGRVIEGIEFSPLISYMVSNTDIPEEGNIYQPSLPDLERKEITTIISYEIYGGMDIQIGYCNGKNSGLNGMEYHKGSEVLVAVTDCLLFLGHIWDLEDNQYNPHKAETFFVKAGEAVELYQTTLHLSPCRVYEKGFKAIIILPKGTNLDFEEPVSAKTEEGQILLKKNKWIITHKDWEPLLRQGVKPGISGERISLYYLSDTDIV